MSAQELGLLLKATEVLGLEACTSSARLEGGVINDIWRLETSAGTRVVRVYPARRQARQVAFEVALHAHLRQGRCAVPEVLHPKRGERVALVDGRPAIVLEFLDARPLAFEEGHKLSPERLRALLGPIDRALEEFAPPFRPVAETRVFQGQLPSLLSQFGDAPLRRKRLEELFLDLKTWETRVKIPTRVIHADIHAGNVLIARGEPLESGELWLIDFDDAHVSYRMIDWVLPALEFSLHRDGTIDETRYDRILTLLSQPRTPQEFEAFSNVRTMMLLKFAASFARVGHPPDENPYLLALGRAGLT